MPDVPRRWRKSSYSAAGSDCVEIANDGDRVGLRHSGQPDGPILWITETEWTSFLDGVKRGDFHLASGLADEADEGAEEGQ
jgi:Domain of unknown function (DUF397)